MNGQERFGIFGGTFAPVHCGHLQAARLFYTACTLDRLHIIPTYQPPHKQAQTLFSLQDRMNMLSLAIRETFSDEQVYLDDYEIQQGGISYTYKTLEHYQKEGRKLFFLCGTDMFLTLAEWKNPQRIFELADIVYVLRQTSDPALQQRLLQSEECYRQTYGARITSLSLSPIAVSSTDLRQQILCGNYDSAYLPSSVKKYLKEQRERTP